jgi:two-component system response regulator AtoC
MILSIETALVVDDDVLMREFVVETLLREGIQVTQAGNGLEGRKLLEEKAFDIAFLDLKMPGLDGLQLLKHMKTAGVETLPVIITAFGTVEKAVEAMRAGAYDFLMKPFSPEQVEIILKRAREWVALQAQNTYLQEELGWKLPRGRQFLGQSRAFENLTQAIAKVAKSNSSVLLSGETGTGKELVALAIHAMSDRSGQPFIRLNCAAVPDTLMDSELFGHEKGAFTSAVSMRVGRFELAHKGTILLDEISEMPLGVQSKLLRVLQEREFERVGGSRTIRVDCRVIATTNRDLKAYVQEGKFRQDLYFRLNVVPIAIPPLRERPEDIPLLANSFLERFCLEKGPKGRKLSFSADVLNAFRAYAWPGNVRELENLVERLAVMEDGPEIGLQAIPEEILRAAPPTGMTPVSSSTAALAREVCAPAPTDQQAPPAATTDELNKVFSLPEIERLTIIRALEATGGNRTKSAELLNISIRTLRNKLNEYRQQNALPQQFVS